MKAGPELDALVATEVMGWELLTIDPEVETTRQVELERWLTRMGVWSAGDYWIDVENDVCLSRTMWKPSTDNNDAGQVIEEMIKQEYRFELGSDYYGSEAEFEYWTLEEGSTRGNAAIDGTPLNTIPLAVCLAALEARGWSCDE